MVFVLFYADSTVVRCIFQSPRTAMALWRLLAQAGQRLMQHSR